MLDFMRIRGGRRGIRLLGELREWRMENGECRINNEQ